ncbi:MAG: hypothetical protein UY50_C0026G0018 [Parcubacteria group bacterium GW2011_GWA2_49_9]|nr:MAG: hypothetical protein UY50_C0026G0018 [Parcubacteria group bacterium GW2011_GWA2_49_9]
MLKTFFLKAKSYKQSTTIPLKAGFTLIELLVVIAIIGILSSVVLASLNSARTKTRDTKRVADIKQLQIALELYYDANSEYPGALTALVGSSGGASLSVLPVDPRGTGNETNVANGYKYAINSDTTPTAYHLGAVLEQTAVQTTLDDADRDMDSTAVAGFETNTTESIPFNANQDATTPIYDVSNI